MTNLNSENKRFSVIMNTSDGNITEQHQEIENGTEKELFRWLINTSEIAPGASAIIGSNYAAFYLIHHIAQCLITVSLVASIIVLLEILKKWKESSSKVDVPIRFPMYLAIADMLWGISHFADHLYLAIVQRYPENSLKLALSINLWFFFGYQQLMHAGIAGYTYLRVVHSKTLCLGKWEWKLHSLLFGFLSGTIVVFCFMGSYGNSGYWMGWDATTINGQMLGLVACFISTFNGFTTTLGYQSIRRTVMNTKRNLRRYEENSEKDDTTRKSKRAANEENIASQCLTTYVYIASCLYCPLAVLLWVNVSMQIFMGVIEPLSCLLIVIVQNSSGWANAYGYFLNERIKQRKEKRSSKSSNSDMGSVEDRNSNTM